MNIHLSKFHDISTKENKNQQMTEFSGTVNKHKVSPTQNKHTHTHMMKGEKLKDPKRLVFFFFVK